jgi:tetratricopeptide (TPR) repeat protein
MAQDDAQQLFEEGVLQRDQGNLDAAIKAFQTILNNQPNLHRARLELAVAYLQALNYEQARKNAEQVLNDPATPESVKRKIREFLAKVTLASSRHTWIPKLSVGYMYDSNVPAGPDESILSSFPSSSVTTKIGDSAVILNAGFSHRYISDRNVRVGDTGAAYLWLTQFNASRTDYSDKDYGDYDLEIASLGTGPSLIAHRWRAGLNLQVDHVRLDEDKYGLFSSINPHLTLVRNNRRTEITMDAFLQRRSYSRSADQDRSSNYRSMGLSVGHLQQNDKLSLQGGIRLFSEDANTSRYSNNGFEVFVGGSWRHSKALTFYARSSRKEVEYSGAEPAPTSVFRDESQNRHVAGVHYAISKGPLAGWTIKASVTRTENNSNAPLYDYDRTQTAMIFERAF